MESSAQSLPFVSVIVPCRNEVKYIRECLESILANDYPADRREVLVVDGMSDDGTRGAAEEFVGRDVSVRLVDNPNRIVSSALNIGIGNAKGEVIMRMDAHCRYPLNYISDLVAWLERSGADNVGGVCHTVPAGETAVARGIAVGLSHPFGVGNSYFRIGSSQPRWVDTVPFGCFRRELFDRVGMFDEELVRNQDDEFNHRLIRRGGRILLVPQIATEYYGRDSLEKLWRMYYQYGYFKPLVARKIGGILTVRQTVPAVFLLSLVGSALLALWLPVMRYVLGAILAAYGAAVLGFAASVMANHGAKCGLVMTLVFPTLHLSYGLGSLRGLFDFLLLRRSRATNVADFSITR